MGVWLMLKNGLKSINLSILDFKYRKIQLYLLISESINLSILDFKFI